MVHLRPEAAFSISATRKADPLVLTFESKLDAIILSGGKVAEPQLGTTAAMPASRLGPSGAVRLAGRCSVGSACGPASEDVVRSGQWCSCSGPVRHPGESHALHCQLNQAWKSPWLAAGFL
jgi:hypothetical protein